MRFTFNDSAQEQRNDISKERRGEASRCLFSGVGGIFHCTTLTHKKPNNNGNGKQPQQPELINIPTAERGEGRELKGS